MTCQLVLAMSLIILMPNESFQDSADHYQPIDQFAEVPNKLRYAKIVPLSEVAPPTIEQIISDYGPRLATGTEANKYQTRRRDLSEAQTVSNEEGALDSEDKRLLDKFYRETRNENPFQGALRANIEGLWNDHDYGRSLDALVDLSAQRDNEMDSQTKFEKKAIKQIGHNDWTIDPQLLAMNHLAMPVSFFNSTLPSILTISSNKIASYSPVHRLLTSYDPIEEHVRAAMNTNQERGNRENRVVGVTLYGKDQPMKPVLNSKSSEQAIKLHNELLEKPPRDGIARVRMYFHRAIHDDVKLYGTGPWKYWGHGWGVEFGFDPRNTKHPNLYQKGYTIERAYGRDFCKDKKNCRPPDPHFFEALPKLNNLRSAKK